MGTEPIAKLIEAETAPGPGLQGPEELLKPCEKADGDMLRGIESPLFVTCAIGAECETGGAVVPAGVAHRLQRFSINFRAWSFACAPTECGLT
jgi:hypothetical protein